MKAFKTVAKACLRTFTEAVAVIVLTSLLAFCFTSLLGGCSAEARLPDGIRCEKIQVSGEVSYVVAYRKDDAWFLSAPGEGASVVHEGQILTIEKGAQMGVIAFLDDKRAQARAYNWNEHGEQKRFCLE